MNHSSPSHSFQLIILTADSKRNSFRSDSLQLLGDLADHFPLSCASQLLWVVLLKEDGPRLFVSGSLAKVEVFEQGAWINSVYALHHIGLEVERVWNVFRFVYKRQTGYFKS